MGPRARHVLPVLIAVLPALLWLAPALRDPRHTIIGWEGDNLFFVRQFWWIKHSLIDLRISPWFDPNAYWPEGYALTRGDLTFANTFAGLPVTVAFGPVAAYNAMLVLSFILTACATYAWAYRLTGSRGASAVAAVVASMAPYRLARAPGDLNVITTQWFSCALWTFEEYLRARRSNSPAAARWTVALGLSFALVALSSLYSAYQLAFLFPIYAALRISMTRGPRRYSALAAGPAVAAAIALVAVSPAVIPYARSALHGGLVRQFQELNYWSLNVYDFVLPNADHPLLNSWMTPRFPTETMEWAGRGVSLGYVAMALAIGALVWRRENPGGLLAPLVGVAVVSALIALGPMVFWGDRPVFVPMPRPVMKLVDWLFFHVRPMSVYRTPLWISQETWIPLPSLVLWLFVPATAGMRAMSRFGYWTVLMIAGLAAFGARHLLWRAGRPYRRIGVTLVLVCAVAFESWSIKTVTRWEPRPVDLWVATQPNDDVMLELPSVDALRAGQDYFITVQQHRTALGPQALSYEPAILGERRRVLERLPSDAALASVRSWGTTLVIVHSAWAGKWPEWEGMFARAHAKEAARFGETVVYRLH